MWEAEGLALDTSCKNRFRGTNDVSHWLMRYWNLCSGKFVPRNINFGRYFEAGKNNSILCDYIRHHKVKTICINDMAGDYDFEIAKQEINAAFRDILRDKSSFEK